MSCVNTNLSIKKYNENNLVQNTREMFNVVETRHKVRRLERGQYGGGKKI